MIRRFSLFKFAILLCGCTSLIAQKYVDENDLTISKSEFVKKEKSMNYLVIPGDSINDKKLIARNQSGHITNRALFISTLKQTNLIFDSSRTLVIMYHPGKDPCNSTRRSDKNWLKKWYGDLEDGLNQIAGVKPIYLYKDQSGLEKYEGIINWHQDPDHFIEKIFFKYPYPCASFVVISKNGDYISYLGEFLKEYVWEATQKLMKNEK